MRARSGETMRSPRWIQSVDDPRAWATQNRWLLETVFEIFDRTGEWPAIEDVQRVLAEEPERAVAVRQLVFDIPPTLGARFSQHAQLTVPALAHCRKAAPLLELFVRVMQEAMRRYPGESSEQPTLRGSEIQAQFELDDATYRKVSTLVCSEGWFFGGGGGDVDGDWYRFVRAEILLLNDMTDIDGYLDIVARYRFGPSEVEAPPSRERDALRRPLGWLTKRDLSVLDLLAITVVGGLVVAVVGWILLG